MNAALWRLAAQLNRLNDRLRVKADDVQRETAQEKIDRRIWAERIR